jgi:NADP-dependent 3-hydroxy acid dehydrogenase YdfG
MEVLLRRLLAYAQTTDAPSFHPSIDQLVDNAGVRCGKFFPELDADGLVNLMDTTIHATTHATTHATIHATTHATPACKANHVGDVSLRPSSDPNQHYKC